VIPTTTTRKQLAASEQRTRGAGTATTYLYLSEEASRSRGVQVESVVRRLLPSSPFLHYAAAGLYPIIPPAFSSTCQVATAASSSCSSSSLSPLYPQARHLLSRCSDFAFLYMKTDCSSWWWCCYRSDRSVRVILISGSWWLSGSHLSIGLPGMCSPRVLCVHSVDFWVIWVDSTC
jgi:hypothetical protein